MLSKHSEKDGSNPGQALDRGGELREPPKGFGMMVCATFYGLWSIVQHVFGPSGAASQTVNPKQYEICLSSLLDVSMALHTSAVWRRLKTDPKTQYACCKDLTGRKKHICTPMILIHVSAAATVLR